MSLLLALVTGGPPPTAPVCRRLQGRLEPDAGSVEVRGVIRAGIVASIIVAGFIASPCRPSMLESAPTPQGRISTGFVVASPPPPATFAQRLVPAALTPEQSLTGRISPAIYRGPPLVPERRLRALLEEQPALVGHVRGVSSPAVVVVSWITAPPVFEPAPRMAGRIMSAPAVGDVDTQSGTGETFLIVSIVRTSLASSCSSSVVTVGTSTAAAQPSTSTRLTRSSITTEIA